MKTFLVEDNNHVYHHIQADHFVTVGAFVVFMESLPESEEDEEDEVQRHRRVGAFWQPVSVKAVQK